MIFFIIFFRGASAVRNLASMSQKMKKKLTVIFFFFPIHLLHPNVTGRWRVNVLIFSDIFLDLWVQLFSFPLFFFYRVASASERDRQLARKCSLGILNLSGGLSSVSLRGGGREAERVNFSGESNLSGVVSYVIAEVGGARERQRERVFMGTLIVFRKKRRLTIFPFFLLFLGIDSGRALTCVMSVSLTIVFSFFFFSYQAVALLPQLFVFHAASRIVDNMTSLWIVSLFLSRLLECTFWWVYATVWCM